MIPFASQRGSGQDLATHLLNEYDNEMVELAEVRGAIAPDLHGAFAEWEAQASALTRCKKYLYSLSINPDPQQDPLTREEYHDYIRRVEEKLALTDQPRAVIFHSKYGREHCHVVWSRVDAENEKAVHLAFDKDKLMMVTREFARDHGLTLPDGYFKDRKDGRGEKGEQLSLYDMHQQRSTGFTKEEHQEMVTDCWRASDSPKAFVQALAEKGYLLATGKRPYVLVDFYGGMHSLPKLIADKSVRTKGVSAYLANEYPPEALPSVDEARELVAKHRSAVETYGKAEHYNDELAELKRNQKERRSTFEKNQTTLRQRQHKDRLKLSARQKAQRESLRKKHLANVKRVNDRRAAKSPGKVAKTFGNATGYSGAERALQKYQDRRRTKRFIKAKAKLKKAQAEQRIALARRQEMQRLDFQRQSRALDQLETREIRSFEQTMKRDGRIQARGGRAQMPSLVIGKESPHNRKDRTGRNIQRYRRTRKRDRDNDRGR
jgi:hypothetical protein